MKSGLVTEHIVPLWLSPPQMLFSPLESLHFLIGIKSRLNKGLWACKPTKFNLLTTKCFKKWLKFVCAPPRSSTASRSSTALVLGSKVIIYASIAFKFTGYLATVMTLLHTKFYGDRSITFWVIGFYFFFIALLSIVCNIWTRAADITWDYKRVKWDSIGITEKLLGLQSGSQKKGTKLFGILEGF